MTFLTLSFWRYKMTNLFISDIHQKNCNLSRNIYFLIKKLWGKFKYSLSQDAHVFINWCQKLPHIWRPSQKVCLDRACQCGVCIPRNRIQTIVLQMWYEIILSITVKSRNGKWKSSCRLKNVIEPAELIHEFPFHNICAKWQMQQLKQLTQILLQNHCITIRDFSENYKCCNLNKI